MNRALPLYILRNNVLSMLIAFLVLYIGKKYALYALFYTFLCIPKISIMFTSLHNKKL